MEGNSPFPTEFADSVRDDSVAADLVSLHLVGPDPNNKPVGDIGCVSCAFKLLWCPSFSAEAIGSWSPRMVRASVRSLVYPSVHPVLCFGEMKVQDQSSSAHVAPILCPCKVKVTGTGHLHRWVYRPALPAVKAHACRWFWSCINAAVWRMPSPI